MKPTKPFDLEKMIQWFAERGLNYDNIKFYFWMLAGQPKQHWTLN